MQEHTDPRASRARLALLASFLIQGASFALLVTRIPAIQRHYGIGDGTLTILLSVVPIVAGAGSVLAGLLAGRVGSGVVLRCAQPVVCLALIGVGAFHHLAALAAVLFVFGLCLGATDATMNMQGVELQEREGRSIMLGFFAAYSLGGIAGAGAAGLAAHGGTGLALLYTVGACVTVPAAIVAGFGFLGRTGETRNREGEKEKPAIQVPWKPLLPLCAVMTVAYIGDSSVSNWAATYLEKALHSSDALSTAPYIAYMVTMLVGRSVGDFGVRRWGMVPVVRLGGLLGAGGFLLVMLAPDAWTGIAGFVVLGLGLCVLVPQTFAAAGRVAPDATDIAVARLNIFNYVGFLIGTPLVGGIAGATTWRAAMAVPLVLVLLVLPLARAFTGQAAPLVTRDGEPSHDTTQPAASGG